jgi:biopolymer transport protein ExbB/TolQ
MKRKLLLVIGLGIALAPTCFADASDAAAAGVAMASIAAVVLGIVVAIAWLIFPFIVIGKCNDMIRELKRISGDTAQRIQRPPQAQV